jgi:phosphate transport system substrate-binding protein
MNIVALVHRRTRWHDSCLLLFLPFVLLLVGCSGSTATTNRAACPAVAELVGEGSTFDAPLFNKLFSVYSGMPCGLSVEYYATGSGAGASRLLNQLVDFGATDAPLTDRQLASSSNGPILHVPVTLGAVAISYHLTGVSSPLRLTGEVVASIYLGKVTSWDDPAIVHLNAGVTLPHRAIQVLHRSDGSGTTAIFTHYLAQISPTWKRAVGASTNVSWPLGQGVQGNFGEASAIGETEGSIGYGESSYVASLHLSAASIQNAAGAYVSPSIAGAQAAAASFQAVPADLRFYVVNAGGAQAYPIAGYSWVIVYRHQGDEEKGKALAQLLWWMLHDGQQYARSLSYAPLPANIVTRGEGLLRVMTCGSSATACFNR